MTDFSLVGKGIVHFFLGFIGAIVAYWVFPPIITAMNEVFSIGDTFVAMIWIFLIALYIIFMMIWPAMTIYKGITSG